MFIVVAENLFGKDVGKILGRFDTLNDARRKAYANASPSKVIKIYDDSAVEPIVFIPTGQRIKNTLGEEIAEVHMHGAGVYEGVSFYYPHYHSQYYKKRNAKYHKYILHRDGSLGQGMW